MIVSIYFKFTVSGRIVNNVANGGVGISVDKHCTGVGAVVHNVNKPSESFVERTKDLVDVVDAPAGSCSTGRQLIGDASQGANASQKKLSEPGAVEGHQLAGVVIEAKVGELGRGVVVAGSVKGWHQIVVDVVIAPKHHYC